MSSKFFYHGLKEGKWTFVAPTKCIDKIISIIQSGGLKSKRLLGINKAHGYNGIDYISLCRIEEISEYSKHAPASFFHFIYNNFCFIVSDEVHALKTEIINKKMFMDFFEIECFINSSDKRYSDMFDEWQVYREIPMRYIIGVGIPSVVVERYKTDKAFMDKLYILKDIVKELNLDIVDTSNIESIKEFENSKNDKKKKL